MTGTPPEGRDGVVSIGGLSIHPGQRIGPYIYQEIIGTGGMALVLLAQDPDGESVALKVLRASRLQKGQGRFRREFRALARIQHPNVIRVVSFGDIHGHPYIAMEYVDGRDLHAVIRGFSRFPPAQRWKRCQRILVDICRALAHIHRRGLIHRDLKPSNILLDQRFRSKLTDFGIVKDLDPRSDPMVSNTLVGTWAYASPEQISGGTIDHRSDLYSLGVILFVMLTGKRPFVAKDMAGYLELHRQHEPPRPRDLAPDVPAHLDEICAGLMQKSPRDRLQSAQEVLYRLEGAGSSPADTTPAVGWHPPLVGREAALATLQDTCCRLTQRQGGVVLILGPRGHGRSRLLTAGTDLATQLGFPVHTLHAGHPEGTAGVFQDLFQALRRDLDAHHREALEEALRLLGGSEGRIRGNLRYRLMDGFRDALRTTLEAGPRVLAVDDLHEAPGSIADLLAYLARTVIAEGHPLAIMGTMSSDDGAAHARHLLDESHLGTTPTTLEASPLRQEHVHALLQGWLGDTNGTRALSWRLQQETEGNPSFLVHFIQALVERGVMVKGPGGLALAIDTEEVRDGHLEIPPGVRQLLGQRLARVGASQPAAMRLLEVLAVGGREMDLDLLLEVLDEDEDAVMDRVDHLLEAGLLVEHRDGPMVRLDFSHGKLGDVIYRDLAPPHRASIHRRLAELYEARGGGTASASQVVGEHYRRAGEAGRGFLYLVMAARKLHEQSLFGEAWKLAEHASALEDAARSDLAELAWSCARLELLPVRGDILYGQGQWEESWQALTEALELAERLGRAEEIARTRLALARVAARKEDQGTAAGHVERALHWAQGAGHRELEAEALRLTAVAAWSAGDMERCHRFATHGLEVARGGGMERVRAELLLVLASLRASREHVALAGAALEEAESTFHGLGMNRARCLALVNLAEIWTWQGSISRALEKAEHAAALARGILFEPGEGTAARASGLAALEAGMLEEAARALQHALDILGPLKLSSELVATRFALGRCLLEQGEPTQARRHLAIARGLASRTDPEGYLPLILVTMAGIPTGDADPHQARHLLDQALRIQASPSLPRQVEALVVGARLLYSMGQHREASSVANRAATLARARGLRLWALGALDILASSPEGPGAREARDEATHLATAILGPLPPRMARLMRARPDFRLVTPTGQGT